MANIREDPQPKRGSKKKTSKSAKVAGSSKPTGLPKVIPKRTIVTRSKPPKPSFLSGRNKHKRHEGIALMMSNWENFQKVPLGYLEEEELESLFRVELTRDEPRWSMVSRLHSAYNSKRVKRERAELRVLCEGKKDK